MCGHARLLSGMTREQFLRSTTLATASLAAGCRYQSSPQPSAVARTQECLDKIKRFDRSGPGLRAVIGINPDALAIAQKLDQEKARGPLHGQPILIKDNLDTHDRMVTSAGSLALAESIPPTDSFVAKKLRDAGLVIAGKTNMSEWANFRGYRSISGWSGRGGQTLNPHCLDRSPSGSSSGSAAAVAMGYTPYAVGTETNGSIVSPSACCGIVGFKPTVGLVSRTGIIPISSSQDTAGPMARTVKEASALLAIMLGPDPQDAATTNNAGEIESHRELLLNLKPAQKARIGIATELFGMHPLVDPVFTAAIGKLKQCGVEMVESVPLPSIRDLGRADLTVMTYEYKAGLNDYFKRLGNESKIKTIDDLIAFNESESQRELWLFGQERLLDAAKCGALDSPEYLDAKKKCVTWSDSLKAVFARHQLDAIVAPTSGPAATIDFIHGDRGLGGCSTYAAVAGLPHITIPCGNVKGLPLGLSFFGPSWSEPKLASIALAFESVCQARITPNLLPMIRLDEGPSAG